MSLPPLTTLPNPIRPAFTKGLTPGSVIEAALALLPDAAARVSATKPSRIRTMRGFSTPWAMAVSRNSPVLCFQVAGCTGKGSLHQAVAILPTRSVAA